MKHLSRQVVFIGMQMVLARARVRGPRSRSAERLMRARRPYHAHSSISVVLHDSCADTTQFERNGGKREIVQYDSEFTVIEPLFAL